jgi:hypothetical protein
VTNCRNFGNFREISEIVVMDNNSDRDIDTMPRLQRNGNFGNFKEISEISVLDNSNVCIDTRPREVISRKFQKFE